MTPLPLTPAALTVIASPPQSPGPGLHTETRTEGHETAAASDASICEAGGFGARTLGLSFRLVKMALLLVSETPGVAAPAAVRIPPLMVIGPPSDLTTAPGPTSRFPPWSVRPPSSRYPRACVEAALLGVIHVRSRVTLPSNTSASRPLPLPTLPRTFAVKSADTAGK